MWHPQGVPTDPDDVWMAALVEETARKSALVWLRRPDAQRSLPAWHVFTDGAIHVVGGGQEQRLPDVADGADLEVTLRSKDTGGRLVRVMASATRVLPGTAAWERVVPDLHAKRLNPPDGEEQPHRWARESTVLRLDPIGRPLEFPGHLSHRSHAAEPAPSPATTRGALPFVLGRRARRRR